jgi:ketosteroid isomerase-like protein
VVAVHGRFLEVTNLGRREQGWTELVQVLPRFTHPDTAAGAEGGTNSMSTRETIEGYFSALKQKKGWDSFLSEDMIFTSFTTPLKRITGRGAYLEATRRFYATITALEVKELLIDGDRACALTHYEFQPPGRPGFGSDVAELFGVRDGKIASFDIYFDSAPFPK